MYRYVVVNIATSANVPAGGEVASGASVDVGPRVVPGGRVAMGTRAASGTGVAPGAVVTIADRQCTSWRREGNVHQGASDNTGAIIFLKSICST